MLGIIAPGRRSRYYRGTDGAAGSPLAMPGVHLVSFTSPLGRGWQQGPGPAAIGVAVLCILVAPLGLRVPQPLGLAVAIIFTLRISRVWSASPPGPAVHKRQGWPMGHGGGVGLEERLQGIRVRLELVGATRGRVPLPTETRAAIQALIFSDLPWLLLQIEKLTRSLTTRDGDGNDRMK